MTPLQYNQREELRMKDISDSTKTEADRLLLLVKRYIHDQILLVNEKTSGVVVKQKTMKTSAEEGYAKGYHDALKAVHEVIKMIEKGYIQ